MAKFTSSQTTGLNCLAQQPGGADFHNLRRLGVVGSTLAWLVDRGLASADESSGIKIWKITDAGRVALADGRV